MSRHEIDGHEIDGPMCNVTQDGSVVLQSLREDAVCVLVLGHAFQLFYNYRRSIQLSSLLWLVFCRCFEKKTATLFINVILTWYFVCLCHKKLLLLFYLFIFIIFFIVLLLLFCHVGLCYCDACKCLHGLGICVWFYPNKLMMMMNVIYFQTIYRPILSSSFMSVIFMSVNFMSGHLVRQFHFWTLGPSISCPSFSVNPIKP